MVTVSIVIDHKPQDGELKDVHCECNLLKREDANDVEWQIAKGLESVVEIALRTIATEIYKTERIDEPKANGG